MTTDTGKIRILVAGADKRQVYAGKRLAEEYGAEVTLCMTDGTAEGLPFVSSPEELDIKADILLLPMPCGNGLVIPAAGRLTCSMLTHALAKGALVTGGKMPTEMIEFFHSRGFDTADYLLREELAVKNAVPTAEGALGMIMTESDETVCGMSIAVTGWGRVAKACARLFAAVGASVTVFARNISALSEAESMGYRAMRIDRLAERAGDFRTLVNTVPALVLTEQVLENTAADCLIIDLASKPGGTDFAACAKLPRKAVHALSLPGKCAPVTAGAIIADTVINIYSERSGRNVT